MCVFVAENGVGVSTYMKEHSTVVQAEDTLFLSQPQFLRRDGQHSSSVTSIIYHDRVKQYTVNLKTKTLVFFIAVFRSPGVARLAN